MTKVRSLRVIRFAECVVLSGPVSDILGSAAIAQSREPQAVLMHVTTTPDLDGARSVLLTGRGTIAPRSGGGSGLALATPLARVTSALLADVTELSDTPLVRASLALVTSLAEDFEPGEATGPRALDDALVNLVRGILDEHPRAAAPQSRDASLEVRVEALIEARHTDPRLDVVQLARELHTSRRQLYRHAGEGGVAAMLAKRRVDTARELLDTRPDLTVADISARAGFTSPSRLRAQFLRWTGSTPTEYRRRGPSPVSE